jgi:hypothetical protein
MWEDEVVTMLAAIASGSGEEPKGYEPPAARLTASLEGATPADPDEERRLRRLQVIASDGEVV